MTHHLFERVQSLQNPDAARAWITAQYTVDEDTNSPGSSVYTPRRLPKPYSTDRAQLYHDTKCKTDLNKAYHTGSTSRKVTNQVLHTLAAPIPPQPITTLQTAATTPATTSTEKDFNTTHNSSDHRNDCWYGSMVEADAGGVFLKSPDETNPHAPPLVPASYINLSTFIATALGDAPKETQSNNANRRTERDFSVLEQTAQLPNTNELHAAVAWHAANDPAVDNKYDDENPDDNQQRARRRRKRIVIAEGAVRW